MGGFELDEDQRDAVDKADQVGAALVHLAGDPELRGEEEIVVARVVPIDHPHRLDDLDALVVAVNDPHAFLEQPVDLAVGLDQGDGRAVAGQLIGRQAQDVMRSGRG